MTSQQVVAGQPPPRLGRRGLRLWQDVTAGAELAPMERVLLEEACRLADRLDRLDAFLRGDSDRWLDLVPTEDGPVIVVIDKGLSEARQQQLALKGVLAELRASRGNAAAPKRPTSQPPPKEGAANVPAGVGDLTARIAERRGQATG